MQIVSSGIRFIHHQIHSIFIHQVFKAFLHESYNDRDICDTGFMKLTDDPLHQSFAFYFQQGFRRTQVDRHHSHPETCSQDNGIGGFSLFQF